MARSHTARGASSPPESKIAGEVEVPHGPKFYKVNPEPGGTGYAVLGGIIEGEIERSDAV